MSVIQFLGISLFLLILLSNIVPNIVLYQIYAKKQKMLAKGWLFGKNVVTLHVLYAF